MNRNTYPIYKNDIGAKVIKIGVKNFMCMGETPPMDHPWIFITMKDRNSVHCLYCNTIFKYDPALSFKDSDPADCYAERRGNTPASIISRNRLILKE